MTRRFAPLPTAILIVFALTNVWLIAILADLAFAAPDVEGEKVNWNPPLSASSWEEPSLRPIAAYPQTLAHPIFFKSRAPYVPPPPPPPPVAVAAPPPPIVVPDLAVGGIFIRGSLRKAYLFKKTDPSGTWFKLGENVVGWELDAVDARGVTLEKEGRNIRLQLYPEK
jgi:hypothetical protein